jgi:hypothetical protein
MADIKLTADNSDVLAKLDQIQAKVKEAGDKFTSAFDKMNIAATALGATLLAAAHSTMEFADNITDLATANQLAVGEVLALSAALQQNGGKADTAAKLLQTLSNKTEEAANGNLKSLASFEKLGISLEDIGTKSNTYIRDTLLDNIAKIENPMERNAKAVQMFGKAMIGVDVRKFAEDQKAGREEMEKYAAPLKSAGDAFDKLAAIAETTKIAFAVAFKPFFDVIGKLNPTVEDVTVKFKAMGTALLIIGGAGVARGIWGLVAAFQALRVAVLSNPLLAIASVLAGVGVAAATYFGLFGGGADDATAATDKLNDATKKTGQDISGSVEALKKQADAFAKVGRELQNNFDIALRKYDQDAKNLFLSEDQRKVAEAVAKVEEDGLNAKIKLQELFNALSDDDKARQKTIDAYKSELNLIDQRTAKQKESVTSQIQGISDVIAKMKDYQAAASNQAEFSKLTSDAEAKAMIESVGNANHRIDLETRLMAVQKIRAELMAKVSGLAPAEQQGAIQAISAATNSVDLLKLSYYDLGKTIQENLVDNLVDAQISQEGFSKIIGNQQAAFNSTIQSASAYNAILKDISDQSRTFSAGWTRAFNDYISNASNAATIATSLFNKFSSGIEDYFIDRLKGIDGGWKKFLASLAEDLARSTIKQSLGKLLSLGTGGKLSFGGGSAGGGSRGDSVTNPVHVIGPGMGGSESKLPGITGGDTAKDQTSLWETIKTSISDFASNVSTFMSNMFSGLGNFISNMTNGLGSILSSIGGTLFDVIGSIGGTLFDVIGSIGGTLFDIIGSLGSGLGNILGSLTGGGGGGGILSTLFDIGASLFGFANGGIIPTNRPVVVGERGPELLFGAGGMGVRSNEDSFGGGSTVVTYNINAVDALSFKQMLAQDPTFLYAVTQQGAKGMPVRR